MKNIFLAIVGIFITIYMLLIGANIYSIQTQKNALEKTVSRAVEHALEENYPHGNKEEAVSMIEQEIHTAVSNGNETVVRVQALDLAKGLISVLVVEDIQLITGDVKQIVIEKTAIMERIDTKTQKVSVTFYVDGEVYKEYELTKGEECPLPKPPEDVFSGWVEYGAESLGPIESIGAVWEDKVYLAITE